MSVVFSQAGCEPMLVAKGTGFGLCARAVCLPVVAELRMCICLCLGSFNLCFQPAVLHHFELREGRFRLGRRKKFFTIGVVKQWQRLPRGVFDAPSLETFKARLDGALSNLIHLKMSLLTAGRLG